MNELKLPGLPNLTKEEALELLPENFNREENSCLLGLRGYYSPGKNERGIYDDAIFIIAPECFISFNANCDPSIVRPGVAQLRNGIWSYKIGIHGINGPKEKQYKALVQAAEVVVDRDGGLPSVGFFGINIHRGSRGSTSSLGCQTIHPSQWNSFISTVEAQMEKHSQKSIHYILKEM
jgi:lysozyme